MIYNGKVENDTELMIEVLRDLGIPWVILKINSIYRYAEVFLILNCLCCIHL